MNDLPARLALEAFHRAAGRVPAYRLLLHEAGVIADEVTTIQAFKGLPVLGKHNTFQRFPVDQLCVDGRLGRLASVLTSSGHSGIFAFGLTETDASPRAVQYIDDMLDLIFAVRSRPTLLINCLPMGVKVATQACTLAETSVRADMVIGIVRAFGRQFDQLLLVGETAFIKHVLESGLAAGVEWRRFRINVIVGEEPLAENARKYLERILGMDPVHPERGVVMSSMGVAEIGLNVFSEVPPLGPLIALRRALHDDRDLRTALLGPSDWVPSLFTYDPARVFVEFDPRHGLVLTTLDPEVRLPLIRYATGDQGAFLPLPTQQRAQLEARGVAWEPLEALPIVMISGRGEHVLAGAAPVYPEAVKEGLYEDAELVPLTTANFRLKSGPDRARLRIQLSPGVSAAASLNERFAAALSRYVRAPLDVRCEGYETFGDGMTLDYERKFSYIER